MANIAIEAIPKAEGMFGVKVHHVVTDRASNTTAMRDVVSQAIPGIITYHCHAHLFSVILRVNPY